MNVGLSYGQEPLNGARDGARLMTLGERGYRKSVAIAKAWRRRERLTS